MSEAVNRGPSGARRLRARARKFALPGAWLLALLMLTALGAPQADELPPPGSPFYIQTNGTSAPIGLGDWYTSNVAGAGAGHHYLTIRIPCGWPSGTPVHVDLFSPEMNADAAAVGLTDEQGGAALDFTAFELYGPGASVTGFASPAPGSGIPGSLTFYPPSAVGQPEQWVRFRTLSPATCGNYVLRSRVFGGEQNDQNGWRVRVGRDNDANPNNAPPANSQDFDGAPGTNDEILVGVAQASFQHDAGSLICQTFYEYVEPGQASVTFNNFDFDGTGRVRYYAPSEVLDPNGLVGGTAGTISAADATWNGSGTISRGGDTIASPESGWWRMVTCIGDHNQFIQEGQLGSPRVPMYYEQPPTPALSLSKTNGLTEVSPGQIFDYTITLTNDAGGAAPGAATNIFLTEPLPANVTFQSCAFVAPATGSCSNVGGTVEADMDGWIDAGASRQLKITLRVNNNAVGTVDATANASYEDSLTNAFAPLSASESDPVVNNPIVANDDVAIVPEDGSVVIPVLANDADPDNNIDPASVTITSPASNGTATPNPDGTVTYTPNANYFGPDSFTYQVCDFGGLCDTADVTVTVNQVVEIAITKTDGLATVTAGDIATHTYTITVANTGPSDATGVEIHDTWPAQFTQGTITPSQGSCSGSGDFDCALGDLASGASATVTVTYTVPSSAPQGPATNSVELRSSHPGNSVAGDAAEDTTDIVEDTEILVSKTDGQTTVTAGDASTFNYTIDVSNTGPSDADGVTILDTFPAGFSRGALPPECTDGTGDNFTCTFATITAGTTASIDVTYTVPSSTPGGPQTNTVEVTSPHPLDDLTNNVATDTNTVSEETELNITKDDGETTVTAGDTATFTYTITVHNDGPSDATGVTISDTWPTQFTQGTVTPSQGSCAPTGGGSFDCALGTLGPDGTATVTATYTVAPTVAAGTYTNTVEITSMHGGDDTSDNIASDDTDVEVDTDIVLTKADGVATATAGDGNTHTYTIRVDNAGPSSAAGVTIRDTWPAEFIQGVVTPSQGTCTATGGGNFDCNLGTIGPGGFATVTAAYSVPSSVPEDTYTNTVDLISTHGGDPQSGNTATDDTEVTNDTEISISKDDGQTTVVAGGITTYTYSIDITNSGVSDAVDVTFDDDFPSGFSRGALPPGCTGGTGDFSCTVARVAGGSTVTVQVTYTVPSSTAQGTQTNTVEVTSDHPGDVPAGNTDSDSTDVVEQTDLTITKSDGITTVPAGDPNPHTYTITVSNAGPSDATGVTIRDVWPSQFTQTAVTPSQGTCSATGGGNFDCTLGTIAGGGSATVAATYTVASSVSEGPATNAVSIISPHPLDPPAGNAAEDTNGVFEDTEIVISKDDARTNVTAGDGQTYTYKIDVTNLGPSDAEDVVIADIFPTGFTRGALPAQCADAAGDDFTCTFSTITAGSTATVNISYTVPATTPPGPQTNTTLLSSDHPLDDDAGNQATDSTTVLEDTEITVTKDDAVTVVTAGNDVTYTYTITVTNMGVSDANGVTIRDAWPAQFAQQAITPSQGTCTPTGGGNFDCSLGDLGPNGGSATVTATYKVPSSVPFGTYTNTATLISSHGGDDPAGNTDADSTNVEVDTEIVLDKDDGQTTVTAGLPTTYTYTITVANEGPSDATGIAIADAWPTQFAQTSLTPSQGTCTPVGGGSFSCSLGTIAADATATVTATYTVPSSVPQGDYTNTAFLTSDPPQDDMAGNSASDVTAVEEDTEITITKDDQVATVTAGDGNTYTYSININNSGPSDATGVTISDSFPSGFVRGALPPGCSGGASNFTCSVARVAAGTTTTISVTYTVPSSTSEGPRTNSVAVTSTHDGDDPLAGNSAEDTTTVLEATEIGITKNDGLTAVTAGDATTHTYTIQVTNTGLSDARGVTISDVWPAQFTQGAITPSQGSCTQTGGGNFDCTLGTITSGATATVNVTYTVASSVTQGPVTNTVTLQSSHPQDTPAGNSATDTNTVVEDTEMTITKSDGVTTVTAGDGVTYTYTIIVSNAGPSDATAVAIADTWPAQFSQASVTPSQGTCTPAGAGSFTCAVGTITDDESATVTVTYTVSPSVPGGSYTNTAFITSPHPGDNTTLGNSASDTNTVVENTEITISKTDNETSVTAGDGQTYTYSIIVQNAGPSNANNVTIHDEWPGQFTQSSLSTSQGTCTAQGNGNFNCSLGTIGPDGSVTITATYTVSPRVKEGTYTNTVNVTSTHPLESTADNTASDATAVVENTEISITKTDNETTVVAGDGVTHTYSITIHNEGPSEAADVAISDNWPPQFTQGTLTASQGSCTPGAGGDFVCTLGDIGPNVSATVTANYTVAASVADGTYTNTTDLTSDHPGDVIAGNAASDDTSVETRADLRFTKDDSPDPILVDSPLTYTLTVTNLGPSNARSVVVTDDLPAGLTFDSMTESRCSESGGAITCDFGTMTPGTQITWSIVATVGKVGTDLGGGQTLGDGTVLTNEASVTSDTTDPGPSANTDTETTTIEAPNLTLTKTAVPPGGAVGPGDEISYTISWTNSGSAAASNFVITDEVPTILGAVTPTGGGVFDSSTHTISWTIGNVPPAPSPGNTGSVSFTARVGASTTPQTISNTAIGTATEYLGDIESNTMTHDLAIPDLFVIKTSDRSENAELKAFESTTYRLEVRNNSAGNANGVVVRDAPPAYMNYVQGSTTLDGGGVPDSGGTSQVFGSGLTLGTLSPNSSRTITFRMTTDIAAPAGAILENWGYVRSLSTPEVGDFARLRVYKPTFGPALRQSILVTLPSGRTVLVTTINQVVSGERGSRTRSTGAQGTQTKPNANDLPATGIASALLALLALAAVGLGRAISSRISPDILRRRREKP